jgi:hypothetical protein
MPDEIPDCCDSLDWTPQQAFGAAKKAIDEDGYTGVIIVIVNARDHGYDTRYINVGMNVSECITALEIQKHRMHTIMDNGSSYD